MLYSKLYRQSPTHRKSTANAQRVVTYDTSPYQIKGLQQTHSIPTRQHVVQLIVRLVVQDVDNKSKQVELGPIKWPWQAVTAQRRLCE